MIFLRLFRSVGMTAGYQEFSSTSTSCELRYLELSDLWAALSDSAMLSRPDNSVAGHAIDGTNGGATLK
jgi:hypothetical protein